MIKDENLDIWLEQMLAKGESFTFVNGKAEQKDFLTWIEKAREYLLENTELTKDKIVSEIDKSDEGRYKLIHAYIRFVYLENSGIRGN